MQETLFFKSDGLMLHGTLHLPETEKPPFIIGVHGMMSTGDSPKQQDLAGKCNQMGIAYFRFDHRGCGKSQGVFAQVTSFEGRCNDLAAAIDLMLSRPDLGSPMGLFGSSLGGAVVLNTAGQAGAEAVVTLAAPVKFSAIHIPGAYETDPALADLEKAKMEYDVSEKIPIINRLLVCHGDADSVVPYENALQIYKQAKDPKKLLTLPAGDHPLSDPNHQQTFMKNALNWFRQYIAG
jgi:alpha-beta hydrolase superfamily lysophospholipase